MQVGPFPNPEGQVHGLFPSSETLFPENSSLSPPLLDTGLFLGTVWKSDNYHKLDLCGECAVNWTLKVIMVLLMLLD